MRTPNNDSLTPTTERTRTGGKSPERKCILTGRHGERDELIRLAISPDGPDGVSYVLPDPRARAPGRGAWLGVSRAELEAAMEKGKLKGALARAFKSAPPRVPEDLPAQIDALGSKRRGGAAAGGNEEHDQTLNQLLALMDGIGSSPGVLVIAATNRLAALDPALTRPGRFDRILTLSLPDEAARLAILRVHAAKTPLEAAERVLPRVARATAGLSGAELAHLVNEAAIGAVRDGDSVVRCAKAAAVRPRAPEAEVGAVDEERLVPYFDALYGASLGDALGGVHGLHVRQQLGLA